MLEILPPSTVWKISNRMKISACIIARSTRSAICRAALASIAPLVDEILVVDSGSTDATPEIAAANFPGRAWCSRIGSAMWAKKNFALAQATHPWVLSIDADEEISAGAGGGDRAREGATRQPMRPARRTATSSRASFFTAGQWIPPRGLVSGPAGAAFSRRTEWRASAAGACTRSLNFAASIPFFPGICTISPMKTRLRSSAHRCAKYAALSGRNPRMSGIGARVRPSERGPATRFARFGQGVTCSSRGFLDGAAGWDIAEGNARRGVAQVSNTRTLNRERLLRRLRNKP